MTEYQLFDYDGDGWMSLKSKLENGPFETLEQFYDFINSNLPASAEFRTIEELRTVMSTTQLLAIFNCICQQALELRHCFPSGVIKRLNSNTPVAIFSRRDILVLLSHMFLCTFHNSSQRTGSWSKYWVTFENWLTDGRRCAATYLRCLVGYFQQAMELGNGETATEFWNETVTFRRVQIDTGEALAKIQHSTDSISTPMVYPQGKIGDTSTIEMDFANKDIGFGTYGTQEEIVFGSSPELCIAMLFCDTMLDNDAILIKGARKVGQFDGYGSTLKFQRLLPEDPSRNDRILVALDATDYSSYPDPTRIQFHENHLSRDLCKLICGFSALPTGSILDTGNWGCGAFCGNKYLKALLQILASSICNVRLSFYTFSDIRFSDDLEKLCRVVKERPLAIGSLWQYLRTYKPTAENENIFNEIEALATTI